MTVKSQQYKVIYSYTCNFVFLIVILKIVLLEMTQYDHMYKSHFLVTREKKLDLAKKQSSRNVYRCHVVGANGSGKSTFCRNLIRTSQKVSQICLTNSFFLCSVSFFLLNVFYFYIWLLIFVSFTVLLLSNLSSLKFNLWICLVRTNVIWNDWCSNFFFVNILNFSFIF